MGRKQSNPFTGMSSLYSLKLKYFISFWGSDPVNHPHFNALRPPSPGWGLVHRSKPPSTPLSLTSSLGAALGGNLGGVTSRLLALDGGQLAGRARLDVIIPVAGFSRCADYENGYGAL